MNPTASDTLLRTFGRNIDVLAFKRGWSPQQLATRLGVSINSLKRTRMGRGRGIDPVILIGMTELFNCDFNDLLTQQPGVDYAPDA